MQGCIRISSIDGLSCGLGAIILLTNASRCLVRLADGENTILWPSRSFYHRVPLWGRFILDANCKRLTPKENTSHFAVSRLLRGKSDLSNSGAIYTESPAWSWSTRVLICCRSIEIPKSVNFTECYSVIRKLEGLMSKWTKLWECTWWIHLAISERICQILCSFIIGTPQVDLTNKELLLYSGGVRSFYTSTTIYSRLLM
jgi:hypothetical protein